MTSAAFDAPNVTDGPAGLRPGGPIPACLIAGFGASGKANAIDTLLAHKPVNEQWALIAPGARAALPGLWQEAIAPGCPCCTGLTPFSSGLVRLLRRLQGQVVSHLLIEGGSEGHAASVARLMAGEQFRPYVTLTRVVAVINPLWFAQPQAWAQESLEQLTGAADALVASQWDEMDESARAAFTARTNAYNPPKPWTPLAALTPDFAFAPSP
jgi:G3E family GTPase